MNRITAWLAGTAALGVATALAACGGSSSSAPPPVTFPPPAPPTGDSTTTPARFADAAAPRGLAMRVGFSDYMQGMPREFAGGAAAGDVNGDGHLDLLILRGDIEGPALLLGSASGMFTERTPPALVTALRQSGPVFADMDGDGALDLFIGGLMGDGARVYLGDGAGGFTRATRGSGLEAMTSPNTISAAFGDLDGDGDLDMVQSHWGTARTASDPGETETLWRNESTPGTIRFVPATQGSGVLPQLDSSTGVLGPDMDYTFAPNLVDLDGDRDLDLYHVADFGGTRVFINEGNWRFTDVTDTTQITDRNGMGASVGDVDNDGDPDAFVSSINDNQLYLNRAGTLSNATRAAGVEVGGWGWGSCMADFDLDGDLDIYQTNGWVNDAGASPNEPYTEDRTRLWINDGTGGFTDRAEEAGLRDTDQGRGVICADLDGDMDTDVLQVLSASDPGVRLWVNRIDGRGLKVTARGRDANTHGIGAVVSVRTVAGTQTRELRIGSNFTAHDPAQALFGLGEATAARVDITWPDGRTQTLGDVAANTSVEFDSANGR